MSASKFKFGDKVKMNEFSKGLNYDSPCREHWFAIHDFRGSDNQFYGLKSLEDDEIYDYCFDDNDLELV